MTDKQDIFWSSKNIYNRILMLCEQRGWTVNRLAEVAGISSSAIYALGRRASRPSLETLIAICDAMEISVAFFFNEDFSEIGGLYDILCGLSPECRELLKQVAKHMK